MPFAYMRRHQKKIFWVLVIVVVPTFSLWGVTTSLRRNYRIYGSVLGEKIPDTTFNEFYTRWNRVYRLQGMGGADEDRVWNAFVNVLVAKKSIGMKVPEKRVLERVGKNLGIKSPSDVDRVNTVLSRRFGLTIEDYERTMKEMMLWEFLSGVLFGSAKITDTEAREYFRFENTPFEGEMVRFTPADYEKEIHITPEEISRYYNVHREKYRVPEKYRFEYVVAKFSDLEKTVKVSEKEAKDYYEKNKDRLYRIRSKKKADDDAKNSQKKYKPFKEVKNSITRYLRSRKAREKAEEIIKKIEDAVVNNDDPASADMEAMAKVAHAKYGKTDYISESELRNHKDIGIFGKTSEICRLEKGMPSLSYRGRYGYFIVRLMDKKESYIPKLEDVKTKVEKDLRAEKAEEKAFEKASLFAKSAKEAGSLRKAAEKQGYKVDKFGPATLNNFPSKVQGTSRKIAEELIQLDIGEISPPLRGRSASFVFTVTKKKQPDWSKFESSKSFLKYRYTINKAKRTMDRWNAGIPQERYVVRSQ